MPEPRQPCGVPSYQDRRSVTHPTAATSSDTPIRTPTSGMNDVSPVTIDKPPITTSSRNAYDNATCHLGVLDPCATRPPNSTRAHHATTPRARAEDRGHPEQRGVPAVQPAAGHGRTSRRFRSLRENLRRQKLPCHLCSQPIDYTLDWPHPGSFTVDHRKPLSTHPHLAEDPRNLAPAHLDCNSSRGNRQPPAPLGATSRDW